LKQNTTGTLYLLPTPIGEETIRDYAPSTLQVLHSLQYFIVENARTARRWLRHLGHPHSPRQLNIFELPKHSEIPHAQLLNPCLKGFDVGVLSEAGIPSMADPADALVRTAHRLHIPVRPLCGPSSICSAIAASGLNGQNFHFVGYLPRDKALLIKKLKSLEHQSRRTATAYYFMETPYRNHKLFHTAIHHLHPHTLFYVAAGLHTSTPFIRCATIQDWKDLAPPPLQRVPAVFGLWTPDA